MARPAHIASLDLVRLVGALMVLAYHYLWRGPLPGGGLAADWSVEAARSLYLGVHLFFMVSGFVILASIRDRDALAFALARFLRLWPGFAVCMTATAFVLALDGRAVGTARYLANLTFVAPVFGQPFMDGAYWSIVVELVFYAWIAVLLVALRVERHVVTICLVWLWVAVLNESWFNDETLRALALTRFAPWFAIGMLAFDIRKHGANVSRIALALVAVVVALTSAVAEQLHVAAALGVAPDPQATLAAAAAIVTLFAAALVVPLAGRPVWVTIGAATYPLYLLHQEIGYVLIERAAPETETVGAIAGAVAILALAAWLVARFVEPVLQGSLRNALERLVKPLRSRAGQRAAPAPKALPPAGA